jgi:hypothetical protein
VLLVLISGARFRRVVALFLLLCVALYLATPALHAATNVPACGFAEIRGTVTAADTGLPLADIEVEGDGKVISEDTETDASGGYTLTLPHYRDKGPYHITFTPPNNSPYLSPTPTTTQVASGTTTIINAVMPRGGAIVGQVKTADTGQPMEGVRVRASAQVILEDNDPYLTSDTTNAEGRYVLQGMLSGEYVLHYNTHASLNTQVISTYVTAMVGGGNYLSEGTIFTVTAPNTITVDFSIEQGRRVAGQLRRSDNGLPVPEVQVSLYLLEEDGKGRADFMQSDETDSMGIYEFRGVVPGNYLIYARPPRAFLSDQQPANSDLKAGWYDKVPNSDEAQIIVVPEVSSAQTISLNMTLEAGTTITGVVTDGSTGMPVVGLGLDIRPPIGMEEVSRVLYQYRTDASGVYTIPALFEGSYGLLWDPGLTNYGSIGRDPFSGVTVTVSGPGTHGNVDFTVERGGDIQGTLTDSQDSPLEDIEVSLVSRTTGRILRRATTNDAGVYNFSPVAPGEYNIKFDRFDPCGCYNNEYYGGDNPDDADVVLVEPSETTSGINAQLACNAPPVDLANLYLPRVQP